MLYQFTSDVIHHSWTEIVADMICLSIDGDNFYGGFVCRIMTAQFVESIKELLQFTFLITSYLFDFQKRNSQVSCKGQPIGMFNNQFAPVNSNLLLSKKIISDAKKEKD